MSIQIPPKPTGNSWNNYAQRLSDYLLQVRSQLRHKAASDSATENGIFLWDTAGYPVVSKNNAFVGVELKSPGYTVAALPTGVVGQREYVTDASSPSFGVAVSGGGSVVIPVFRNATAWIVA